MTYQEAWKIVLGAIENTYEDNIKEALLLLAEAAAVMDKEQEYRENNRRIENDHRQGGQSKI